MSQNRRQALSLILPDFHHNRQHPNRNNSPDRRFALPTRDLPLRIMYPGQMHPDKLLNVRRSDIIIVCLQKVAILMLHELNPGNVEALK